MGPAIGVELGIATHAAIGAILTDQHRHRTIAFGLDQDATFEFQRGTNHRGQCHSLTQDAGEMWRIVVTAQDRRQAFSAHAHGPAAHGALVDLEVDDEVTVRACNFGHGLAFGRACEGPMWQSEPLSTRAACKCDLHRLQISWPL